MRVRERYVVFDCDGVLLESNEAKAAGFAEVFADRPEHVDAIVALHERYGGISRYVKFDLIYRDILHEHLSAERSRELGAAYTSAVIEQVLAAPEVPGLNRLLNDLEARGVAALVLSGTPQEELLATLGARGLASRFVEIIGSPTTKPEALRRLGASALGAQRDTPVFIGDALSDHEAAVLAGTAFLARVPAGQADAFPADVVRIRDLEGYWLGRDALFGRLQGNGRSAPAPSGTATTGGQG